jgi:hypothetical protein
VEHLPLILIEVVLVFGGALAFGWWQFRDLARERKKREDANRAASAAGSKAASESDET